MKKLLLALGVLALVGGGLAWLARRPERTGSLEARTEAFRTEALGHGTALTFDHPSLPLRAFRWLPPDPTGTVFAQILTQTDRQELAWFREGRPEGHLTFPKPAGLPEGAYRLMELVEALRLPDGSALLAYRAPNTPETLQLIHMDLGTGATRWHAQPTGSRVALASDAKGSVQEVLIYGGARPILRLPLALAKGEAVGALRRLPEGVPLPAELPVAQDLIALPHGLLAAGPAGLATHRDGTWTFEPAPPSGPLGFPEPRARLVRMGRRIFWQHEPGRLLEVSEEALVIRGFVFDPLPLAGNPLERDAALLQLLGADAQGWLWFALATPQLPKALEPPPPVPEEGWTAEAPPTTEPAPGTTTFDRVGWEAFLAQGRGRLYRYSPTRRELERLVWAEAWPTLGAAEFPAPAEPGRLRPDSGWMVAEAGSRAWVAPLKSLPWKKVEPIKAPGTP